MKKGYLLDLGTHLRCFQFKPDSLNIKNVDAIVDVTDPFYLRFADDYKE